MSWPGALVTFAIIWWLFFFMSLPFGVEAEEKPEVGHTESAPKRPRILIKMAVATLLAGLATWALSWVIESGLISLRPAVPGQ